jgi:3-oxoacyl-[acyl-carrier-protein] synthase-3
MNGNDVFNFVLEEIPKDIKCLMNHVGITHDAFDHIVFHQANNFINSFIAKKLKLEKTKIASTIHKFGNTSSVSIPLTITSELKGCLNENKLLLLSAFGVGMSWGTAFVPFVDCKISEIIEW